MSFRDRVVLDDRGWPVLLAPGADPAKVTLSAAMRPRGGVIYAPQHAAVTMGEALEILRGAEPKLTPDDGADLLRANAVARHVCFDHASVLAVADVLRKGGT